jgi:hypothetical protein
MKKKDKEKKKFARNLHAVSAHFRKSGPMKDKKKAANKKACRKKEKNNED